MTSSPASSAPAPAPHVLVTQAFLFNIAGSETVCFEIAEHFARQGSAVSVVVHGYNDLWRARFEELDGVRLFTLDDPELAAHLEQNPVDVAWVQHQIVPEAVLRSRGIPVIFNQMSGAHPMEYPFSVSVVRGLASLVSFNAPEILEIQRATGILDGIDQQRLAVFGNPAPDRFLHDAPVERTLLRRLTVVSNHLAEEVVEAVRILREQHGLEVDLFGLQEELGATPRTVTPETLDLADAVMTIGKTVQYSLTAGVPVYCYDHFGGPGWLDAGNFERARHYNFSGRGFDRKSAELIVAEIIEFFDVAAGSALALREQTLENLVVSQVVDRLVARARDLGRPADSLNEATIQGHLRMQASIGEYVRIAAHNERMRAETLAEVDRVRRFYADVEQTRSFRLARSVSTQVGKVASLVRRS